MGVCAEQAWRSGVDANVEAVSAKTRSVHLEANDLLQTFVGALSKHQNQCDMPLVHEDQNRRRCCAPL